MSRRARKRPQADVGVCGHAQVEVADIPAIKEQGFRSIICNRPDGEGADRPTYEENEAADLARLMTELPVPVLAYCRTGTRPAMLWPLAQAKKRATSQILSAGLAAL